MTARLRDWKTARPGDVKSVILGRQSTLAPQELRRVLLSRKNRAWWIMVPLLLLVTGCTTSKATTEAPAAATVTAAKTTAPLNIDGKIDEDAWGKAAKTTISLKGDAGVEANDITLKVLYDETNIYIAAKYVDSTPLKIGETWEFDGTKWTTGAFDDSLALVWNINGSIKGFEKNGANVMTKKITNGIDIYDFAIDPGNSKFCSPADTEQKGDIWGWCGMPEFYGKGDDMFLSINPGYAKSAEGAKPIIAVDHDAHPNPAPWIKNELGPDNAQPKYMYKSGMDQENTPRPFMEDVVEIGSRLGLLPVNTRLPYIIGIKGAIWGGSKDDIRVKGTRAGNDWNVEFSRALNTGNSDDIKLVPGRKTSFFLIIRDDAKGYVTSMPLTLIFKK